MSLSDNNQSCTRSDRELRNASFSQAQGYEDLPSQLKLEELPEQARVHIWNVFYVHLEDALESHVDGDYPTQEWATIMRHFYVWHDFVPLDELDIRYNVVLNDLKNRILRLPFNQVFDLIQFVMRHSECPDQFTILMKKVFKRCRLAYAITKDNPVTIIPSITNAEGESIVASINELTTAGLAGSASHLRKSAERINNNEWADSVRESIHAVESVARQIAPDKSHTLAQALKSIGTGGSLHPALIEACKRLYGYTSDEEGIRHAMLDRKDSSVGKDEAIFMLGACASFASYLWRKHEAGETS